MHVNRFAYIFGSVLKSRTLLTSISTPLLLAFILLLSSCTKEEMVEPCTSGAAITSKSLAVPNDGHINGPDNGTVRGTEEPTTGEDDGISDDGDDISDNERKKR